MNKTQVWFFLCIFTLFSCGQEVQVSQTDKVIEAEKAATISEVPDQKSTQLQNYIDTRFEYTLVNGNGLIVENSLPKSKVLYVDPDGNQYAYAIFWTRITNKGNDPVRLSIEFPTAAFALPSGSDNYMHLLFPADTMSIEKASQMDYGFSVAPFLDAHRTDAFTLDRTIDPFVTTTFYVVTLSTRGINGTLRTGLTVSGTKLFYRVNEIELPCGEIR